MRLTFLGTGTSMGVPVIGCRCAICRSDNPRNKRLRTSALLEIAGLSILIDAGPDLRMQALHAGIARVDAVLLTHGHADHIAGLDDLRPLNFAQGTAIPLYGIRETLGFVRERFGYAFTSNGSEGSSRPALDLIEITNSIPFEIGPVRILPLAVQHGTWIISGYRIGRLGYVTDASALSEATLEHLTGLDLLVLNALRYTPHPTHYSLDQARSIVNLVQPQRALFVHMAHDLEHNETNSQLPAHVQLAYDGQSIEVAE